MQGAGTSEGYKRPGDVEYACPHGHESMYGHPAWRWWCTVCGTRVDGPEVGPEPT